MNCALPDTLLSPFSEFIAQRLGLHFPPDRWRDLERGIRSAAPDLGFGDVEDCLKWALSCQPTAGQIEILASHLTIGETYFYRDMRVFEVLESDVLPRLISARRGAERRLKIWSAGSSTGEEAYSIAMLLHRLLPDLQSWQITILATDINPNFLKKAAEGVYGDWSFRSTPAWVKERYFRKREDGAFEIAAHIKKMVRFSYLNLAEDSYPSLLNDTSAVDIIFCRNVLIYFTQELKDTISRKLHRSLVEGGWLVVSPSETSHILFSQFSAVSFPGAFFYTKDGAVSNAAQASFVSLPPETDSPRLSFPAADTMFPDRDIPAAVLNKRTEEREMTGYEQSLAYYQAGRFSQAGETLAKYLDSRPADAEAIILMAKTCANQGKLSEALEWCRKSIALDKLNPVFHYLLATILQERGEYKEAGVSLRRVLYLDQNFVLAHFGLGNLMRLQGKHREAKKYFENVLAILQGYGREDELPEADGMTAGRLVEIIHSTFMQEKTA